MKKCLNAIGSKLSDAVCLWDLASGFFAKAGPRPEAEFYIDAEGIQMLGTTTGQFWKQQLKWRFNTIGGLSQSVRSYSADVQVLARAAEKRLPGSDAFQNFLLKVPIEKINLKRPDLVDMKGP